MKTQDNDTKNEYVELYENTLLHYIEGIFDKKFLNGRRVLALVRVGGKNPIWAIRLSKQADSDLLKKLNENTKTN